MVSNGSQNKHIIVSKKITHILLQLGAFFVSIRFHELFDIIFTLRWEIFQILSLLKSA